MLLTSSPGVLRAVVARARPYRGAQCASPVYGSSPFVRCPCSGFPPRAWCELSWPTPLDSGTATAWRALAQARRRASHGARLTVTTRRELGVRRQPATRDMVLDATSRRALGRHQHTTRGMGVVAIAARTGKTPARDSRNGTGCDCGARWEDASTRLAEHCVG